MAVSPIDINMMQRINEVAQIKHGENTRPEMQQNVITRNIEKDVNIRAEQVRKKDDANKSETEHDARKEGKNKYFRNDTNNKKKKENEADKVTIKGKSSFDISI